jgi:hypothetical protein
VVAALGLSAFLGVRPATAQTETPRVALEGRGPGGGVLEPYEDIIHEKIAAALGISLEEFEAAREAGATLHDLAQKYGVDFDVVREAMLEGRAEAIKQAVADGVITQEQADWMLQRMGGMGYRRGSGAGACDGTGPIGQGPFGRGRMNQAPLTES